MNTVDTPSENSKKVTACIVLADGTTFYGQGFGATGQIEAELCFNTSMTGYQEIMTDPSYAGQAVTFTFPHIGNTGITFEDSETADPVARAMIIKSFPTMPSNYRSETTLPDWLEKTGRIGVSGIDTRRLTRAVRQQGAPHVAIEHNPDGNFDIPKLLEAARNFVGLEGLDLAKDVTIEHSYDWDEERWAWPEGYTNNNDNTKKVVAIDFGAKRNILRCLTSAGCDVVVLPATATAEDVLSHNPQGVFLSNGPGDPVATGVYAIPMIQGLIVSGVPLFGICLGHRMLALSVGASSSKMYQGHRGGNHPVKDLETGKVEITSQNHGFVIDDDSLPDGVTQTHSSLFDGTLEGIRLDGKPVFSVQYHPEASPGPQDSHYLFDRFVKLMEG